MKLGKLLLLDNCLNALSKPTEINGNISINFKGLWDSF